MDGRNSLLQSIDGGSYVSNWCSLQQLRIIIIQMMTEVKSIDEFRQIGVPQGSLLGPLLSLFTPPISLHRCAVMVYIHICKLTEHMSTPLVVRTKSRGGSREFCWGANYGERGSASLYGGLGACPQWGPGAKPLVRGSGGPSP